MTRGRTGRRAATLAAVTLLAGCTPSSLPRPALPLEPGERQILATLVPEPLAAPGVCVRLKAALEARYDATGLGCSAYPIRVAPARGVPFTAYDLVVTVPAEVMRQREYSTDLIDPIELELVEQGRRVRAAVVLYVLRDGDQSFPVIRYLQRLRS